MKELFGRLRQDRKRPFATTLPLAIFLAVGVTFIIVSDAWETQAGPGDQVTTHAVHANELTGKYLGSFTPMTMDIEVSGKKLMVLYAKQLSAAIPMLKKGETIHFTYVKDDKGRITILNVRDLKANQSTKKEKAPTTTNFVIDTKNKKATHPLGFTIPLPPGYELMGEVVMDSHDPSTFIRIHEEDPAVSIRKIRWKSATELNTIARFKELNEPKRPSPLKGAEFVFESKNAKTHKVISLVKIQERMFTITLSTGSGKKFSELIKILNQIQF